MGTPRVRISGRDRRQQIMQVAAELFARQGFEGTTTRQIAGRARVNEAILFRHFPHKEELYWAVIDDKCRDAGMRARLEEKLRSSAEDREIFAGIAEDILRRNTEDPTLGRLLLFSALENHRLSHRFFQSFVAQRYQTLADHIRARIRQGVFRRIDPLLAARGFLGMVIYHFLIQELFGGKRYQRFALRRVSRTLTDIWLAGMLAGGDKKPKPKNSSRHA